LNLYGLNIKGHGQLREKTEIVLALNDPIYFKR